VTNTADLQHALNIDFNFDPLVGGFPGMVEPFSPLSIRDEEKLDWEFEGFCLSHLDPFEYRRLKVIEYLQQRGHTSSEIACLSSRNSKLFFHAFFRRFQPHSPLVHLPTFEIADLSVSLYFAILLLGALHCGEAESCKVLWNSANDYCWECAKVCPNEFSDVDHRARL
jgi:hypothetical protein